MNVARRVLATVTLAAALGISGAACSSSSSAASFCDKARKYDKDKTLQNADASTAAGANKLKAAMGDMLSSAPSDIKPDVQTAFDAVNKLADAAGDPKKLQAAMAGIDQAKLTKASDNVTKYLDTHCGIKSSS